jgi:hypothetical protein
MSDIDCILSLVDETYCAAVSVFSFFGFGGSAGRPIIAANSATSILQLPLSISFSGTPIDRSRDARAEHPSPSSFRASASDADPSHFVTNSLTGIAGWGGFRGWPFFFLLSAMCFSPLLRSAGVIAYR